MAPYSLDSEYLSLEMFTYSIMRFSQSESACSDTGNASISLNDPKDFLKSALSIFVHDICRTTFAVSTRSKQFSSVSIKDANARLLVLAEDEFVAKGTLPFRG